jgi:hypothetical protein
VEWSRIEKGRRKGGREGGISILKPFTNYYKL